VALVKFPENFKVLKQKFVTFSGTVKVEDVFAARIVNLYNQATGLRVGSAISNPTTGAWSISVSDNANGKYYAICLAINPNYNHEIFGHLSGV
jgi:hypothetical protein